jgi:hypothetical protein
MTRPDTPSDAPMANTRAWMSRNLWVCPLLAIAVAAAILAAFGLSVATAIVAAVLLVCPVLLLWGVVVTRRRRSLPQPRDAERYEPAHGDRNGR